MLSQQSIFGPYEANTINVKHLQQAQIEENRGVGPFDYKKWKSEQPAVCCVCLDDMETESMLVCSNEQCDVCVHYDCYAVPHNVKASTKAWSCDYCVAKTKGKAMEEACILCPAKGGALKRVGETTSWVHVACALWIPEVEYDPVTGHVSLLKVPAHRYNNFCCLCAEPEDAAAGICISCKIEGSERHFHVTCAMKWGLLERAWKDLLTGGSTDIEELDYSDTSLSFNENPWIKWSSVREATNEIPKVIELTEHSLTRLSQYDTFKSLIKPVPQHLLKTESALEMAVEAIVRKSECEDSKRKLSFPEKFSHHYAMYDDARERFIADSRKETTSLRNEKKELEGSVSGLATEIIALKESCQNQLDEFDQNVSELKKNHMALLAVFKHAFECGWDFSVLFDEEQDSEPFMQAVQNIRSKGSLDEKDFMVLIELLLHAQKPFFTSSFSQELIIEVLRNTLPDMKNVPDLPNLSKITTSLYSEFPSQKTNGLACDYCKSRVLPDSAPVRKEFRDYLLICCKCGSGFHLCCVQPEPLRQLPEEPDCWECFDCLHGCTILKDECEDMLVDSEAYSVRKRARTASTTGPGRRVRKGSYAGPGRPPRMPVSASMSSLESKSWLSWEEARKSLLSLCAPCPPIPEKLQKKEGNELVLRLFVLKDPSEEEIQQLVDVALWRILTNIPPQADSRDILAMVAEGEAVGFGKFQRVMRSSNGSFESSQRSLSESALLSRSLSASHPTLLNSQQSISPTDLADVLNMGSDDRLSDPPDEEMEERRSVTSYITGSQDSLAEPKYSLCKIERQPSKWDGDLYKPFWTRGNGRSKEGWCGLCQPGHWLKTKTSVYWYHMHNYHGVSSVAGTFFQPPEELRDLEGVTEGRCHQCQKWIPIQGDKSLNVEEIYWYKHAQKCHKYSNEDAPFDNTSLQDEDEEYI